MFRTSGISLGLALAMAACTPSSAPPPQTDRVLVVTETRVLRTRDTPSRSVLVDAHPARVLPALSAAYSDLGIEVKVNDPSSGQVGNRNFVKTGRLAGEALSKIVRCGMVIGGDAADHYRVTMSIISYVTPQGGGSSVETWLTAAARDPGTSTGRLACTSTGLLEDRINRLVVARVAENQAR